MQCSSGHIPGLTTNVCSALNGSRLRVAVDTRVICLSVISFRDTTLARQPWRQCNTANLTGTGSVDLSVCMGVCEGVEHGRLVWGMCEGVEHGRLVWGVCEGVEQWEACVGCV